jgi:hypothetical protein
MNRFIILSLIPGTEPALQGEVFEPIYRLIGMVNEPEKAQELFINALNDPANLGHTIFCEDEEADVRIAHVGGSDTESIPGWFARHAHPERFRKGERA